MADAIEFRGMGIPRSLLAMVPLRTRRDVELCKRGEMREARFLDVATEVFAEKGYQHAKLSEIVARAGGSLATLYRIFGDKEGLAHAIVERRIEHHVNLIRDLNLSGLPPEKALRKVAIQISQSMAKTESLVVYRIVIGAGQDFPGLRDWYFSHAVPLLRAELTEYFAQEMETGRLQLESAETAAAHFHMMLFGDIIIGLSSGYLDVPDAQQLQARALSAVNIFLRGAMASNPECMLAQA